MSKILDYEVVYSMEKRMDFGSIDFVIATIYLFYTQNKR